MYLYIYSWAVSEDLVTVIRGYGVDQAGNTICLVVEGFTPYIYIEMPFDTSLVAPFSIQQRLVYKKHLYNTKPGIRPFLHCTFRSRKQISFFMYRHPTARVHEQNATSVLQMLSLAGLSYVGWVEYVANPTENFSNCDATHTVDWHGLQAHDLADIPALRVCSFDLEVYSTVPSAMPADRPGDEIFQIGCCFSDGHRVLLTLAGDDLDDADMECNQFNTERDLILGFTNLLLDRRPHLITGYNILGFDLDYLIKRCRRLFIVDALLAAGMGPDLATVRESKWSSSAFKDQSYKYIDWEGVVLLDLLPLVKRDFKLSNYKLETVAQTILQRGKDPITITDIFRAYQTRKLQRVGFYCLQDSQLCLDLLSKLHTWVAMVQMARVCHVGVFTLYTQGQQIKIFSQVYRYCIDKNIVVDTDGYTATASERYTGGYVYEPTPGLYTNVVPLDFSSLYPSIIIGKNICYSTLAGPNDPDDSCHIFDWWDHVNCVHDPKIIERTALTIRIDALAKKISAAITRRNATKLKADKAAFQCQIDQMKADQRAQRLARVALKVNARSEICQHNRYRFLKDTVKVGIIPTIIQELLASRKRIRQQLATETNEIARVILDKRQLAFKVSANSMYGAMGVRKGYLPFMPGAMCVTYTGRTAIQRTTEIIKRDFEGTIVYGDTDSNYIQFPEIGSVTELWDRAIDVAAQVSTHFPKPMKLEFENVVYTKFLILGKKRYVYQTCDRMGKIGKLGNRGVISARRDNVKLVREAYNWVVEAIFNGASLSAIETYLHQVATDIIVGLLTPDMYVATKSIGDSQGECDPETQTVGAYKVKMLPDDPELQKTALNGLDARAWYVKQLPAQIQLAEKMAARGIPVAVGSRIEYVVLAGQHKTLGPRLEEYDYYRARARYLTLDKIYYIRALVNPLDQVLQAVFPGAPSLEKLVVLSQRRLNLLEQLKTLFGPTVTLVARRR